ncbi:hypothetical protein [Bdellovibrio bacteriovorus]|uniref:hypothetical protein n=1 Tax=Bdellovibrio bacteriovorus TaxID=959 RepID=UPI000A9729A4|nr:hypothetical protein [Bdellovibrio bacteriovorus]
MGMKFVLAFIVTWALQAQAAWDLNDVSYLMPLPKEASANGLLGTQDMGKGGALLTASMLERMPPLALHMNREQTAQAIKVVAVRIDPCFPLPTPQSCQKQIRLVWQPFELTRRGTIQSVDAAVHTFYVLTDDEFKSLLKDLAAWKKKYPANTQYVPLQVHPAWANEGDQSASLQDFNAVIKKYAGLGNISRATVMVLRGAGDMWAFAGFSYENGAMDMFPVPRLNGRTSQAFVNTAIPFDHFSGGGISPAPKGANTFNYLVAESARLGEGTEEMIRNEVRAAFRVENPKNFNPENLDCVSCHVAQPAIRWVLDNRSGLKADQLWDSEIYKNVKYDLKNVTPDMWNTRMIRGFGYFNEHVSISQRVINESAEVADMLNQDYNLKKGRK